MKRRDFLRLAGGSALALPVGSARAATKKVIVVGAGLAGLAAAEELRRAHCEVTILEARARAGGRVQTLRAPFGDGLHAEAGALFVPEHHDITLRYAKRFGLRLEPAMPSLETRLFYVRGHRVLSNRAGKLRWPFDLTPEEAVLGRSGMWQKYIGAAAEASLEALDGMSVAEFLRSRGASPEAVALLRVGPLDMMGEGIESYSALQMSQRFRHGANQSYTISGGSDRLPTALAQSLEGAILYGCPVARIEPGKAAVSVFIESGRERRRLAADYVICTIPFSVLRRMDVSAFSSTKARAINDLSYTSVVRVFLQFARKVWTSEHLHFLTVTDLPVKWVFDHTVTQPGRRGILEAQVFGAQARTLAGMTEDQRIEFALSQLEQIFPGVRRDYERGTSKCWDDDPWARGAFPYYRPAQMLSLAPHIARSEGRVHFAGEHTSPWSGWMEGALESGLRAAREVSQA